MHLPLSPPPAEVEAALARAGCVAAAEEAAELWAAAGGDGARLARLVARRQAGEPLAWLTGRVVFCGVSLGVTPGVYVPRWQSEGLARRAARRLPPGGRALDLCTGAGAVAAVLIRRVPGAEVLATDLSAAAVDCARSNGVDARLGSLDDPVPPSWEETVDVLTAVVPYVPSEYLHLLDRDSRLHEPPGAHDGGARGMRWLEETVRRAPRWLRPGSGSLLLELGGEQAEELGGPLRAAGFRRLRRWRDAEGDVRGIEAVLAAPAAQAGPFRPAMARGRARPPSSP